MGLSKIEKIKSEMEKRCWEGLIIYSSGISSILRPNYFLYFTGFRPIGSAAAFISLSGRTSLLVTPKWDLVRASEQSWIKDVRPADNFNAELLEMIKDLRMFGNVGVVGMYEMAERLYVALENEVSVKAAEELMEEIARHKTAEEIEVVRKAAQIADVGVEAFVDCVRPGIREYELVAEMEYRMRVEGADDMFLLMSSSPHNKEMHEPTDRRIKEGDIVIGEITPGFKGQFIQVCITVVVGKPPAVLRAKYELLVEALEETIKEMKPGVPASIIVTTMNRVLTEAGYGDYCRPPYMRSRGHGFGVGSIAPGPELTENLNVILEKNQVIAVHPNQYIPETGYLACGETVLVTETGIERLVERRPRLYIKEV